MPDDAALEDVLAAMRQAAGRGDLRAIEALAPVLIEAAGRLDAAVPDPGRLTVIRAEAARLASRLAAMREGLHAARARLAEIARLGSGEIAYDRSGARRLIAPAPGAAPHRR